MKLHSKFTAIMIMVLVCLAPCSFAAKYQYDSLNRLSKVTYDNGLRIVYTYDSSGNRRQRIVTTVADIDADGGVNFQDFARLASQWLETNCAYPDLCGQADLDWDTKVGIEDLVTFTDHWLTGFGQ